MNTQAIERIRASYTEKEITKFDELKKLDKKVKRPVQIFAYVYGSLSSLVLGTGMCLAMKIIGASISALMPVGIAVGIVGIAMVSTAYPIYKKILEKRKKQYSNEIIEKSNELLNN